MGDRADPSHIQRARLPRPKHEAPLGQPERISASGQVDELGIDTVDEVPTIWVALTRRCVPSDPSKHVQPLVVLHPFGEGSEEQDGLSKVGDGHGVKHERPIKVHA